MITIDEQIRQVQEEAVAHCHATVGDLRRYRDRLSRLYHAATLPGQREAVYHAEDEIRRVHGRLASDAGI